MGMNDAHTAAGCTDDALSDGLTQVMRIADGKHNITNLSAKRRVLRNGWQIICFNANHCEVSYAVITDDLATVVASVLQRDLNLIDIGNHMVSRENMAAVVHDHTGAQTHHGAGAARVKRSA